MAIQFQSHQNGTSTYKERPITGEWLWWKDYRNSTLVLCCAKSGLVLCQIRSCGQILCDYTCMWININNPCLSSNEIPRTTWPGSVLSPPRLLSLHNSHCPTAFFLILRASFLELAFYPTVSFSKGSKDTRLQNFDQSSIVQSLHRCRAINTWPIQATPAKKPSPQQRQPPCKLHRSLPRNL